MRKEIPFNNVSHDYERVLKNFVSQIQDKLGKRVVMVYLTGSYARGDATDYSDMDVFCIFDTIDPNVLMSVGFCARNTSIPYEVLEINTQCMSVEEYKSKIFENWSEYAVSELNSVILYGNELVSIHNTKEILGEAYRRCLADVIMSIRHYICVDKPKEKLTHDRMKTYVLKPLMFALRQERFCKTGIYPLSINDLLASYSDDNKILIEYFIDKDKFERDIERNHKDVLIYIHNLVYALCW
jgi:Nucleotidyltransferase domain.